MEWIWTRRREKKTTERAYTHARGEEKEERRKEGRQAEGRGGKKKGKEEESGGEGRKQGNLP